MADPPDWQQVLQSVYCRPGECHLLDAATARLELDQGLQLTLSQDGCKILISISCSWLNRKEVETCVEQVGEGDLEEVLGLVEKAIELMLATQPRDYNEVEDDPVSQLELVVAKLDHMRSSTSYMKLLERWCSQLSVKMVVVVSRDRGILVVLEGEGVARLLQRWKTENVDVDSRGRPCKERMLQVWPIGMDLVRKEILFSDLVQGVGDDLQDR